MALIKCPYCGVNISDKAHRCPKCGQIIQPSDISKVAPQQIASSNISSDSAKTSAEEPIFCEENEKRGNFWPWVIAGGVILIGVGVWLFLSKNTTSTRPETICMIDSTLEEEEEEMPVAEVISSSIAEESEADEAVQVVEEEDEDKLDVYIGEPPTKQGTYELTGKVDDKYDIKIWVTIKENKISGKYCYKSTLEKYGDKPSSYIQFEGLISPADYFIIKASSKDSSRTDKWEGDFKDNRLYAEKILETGEIRTMEAYIDE